MILYNDSYPCSSHGWCVYQHMGVRLTTGEMSSLHTGLQELAGPEEQPFCYRCSVRDREDELV